MLSIPSRAFVQSPDADRQLGHVQIRARLSPVIGLILTLSATAKTALLPWLAAVVTSDNTCSAGTSQSYQLCA